MTEPIHQNAPKRCAASEPPDPSRLDVQGLTWSVLLARWVEFAQAALAWPDESQDDQTQCDQTQDKGRVRRDGAAWRASVPTVIQLQALWFALGQAKELSPAERALARDRAAVSFAQHRARLASCWGGQAAWPGSIHELVHDVQRRLAGVEAIQEGTRPPPRENPIA